VILLLRRRLQTISLVCRHPACRDSDRQSDNQKARQMMRADIDRIEMKREREHHHRVLGARGKGDHDIGDRKRE
jgi:hypothetical protein